MPFELADAELPVPDDARAALRREWRRLAAAGTWCDGAQRVAIAATARAARSAGGRPVADGTPASGDGTPASAAEAPPNAGGAGSAGEAPPGPALAEPLAQAAAVVATAPATITAAWVDDLLARGLSVEQYVEVAGVGGRLAAVDTYVAGVGAATEPLPAHEPGEPSRRPNPAAVRRGAFVPTDPADDPPFALSAVPAEADAQMDLHGALYLTLEQMEDLTFQTHLSRPQMELLAARTSYVNGCRF